MPVETFLPDRFFFEKNLRGRENVAIGEMLEHLCMFCNLYTFPLNPAEKESRKRLNQERMFELIKRVKQGEYTDVVLYKDDRAVFEIYNKQWNTLQLHLTRDEALRFREFLVRRSFPRTLFVPAYDPAVAERKSLIRGRP